MSLVNTRSMTMMAQRYTTMASPYWRIPHWGVDIDVRMFAHTKNSTPLVTPSSTAPVG